MKKLSLLICLAFVMNIQTIHPLSAIYDKPKTAHSQKHPQKKFFSILKANLRQSIAKFGHN